MQKHFTIKAIKALKRSEAAAALGLADRAQLVALARQLDLRIHDMRPLLIGAIINFTHPTTGERAAQAEGQAQQESLL